MESHSAATGPRYPQIPLREYERYEVVEETAPGEWLVWNGPLDSQDVAEQLLDDHRREYPMRTFRVRELQITEVYLDV